MAYETIIYEEIGPVGKLTLNRPDNGNMFNHVMCHEICDCINQGRRETRTRVMILTGAGDRFFCIGGNKEGMEDTRSYAGVLPTLDVYEAIDRLQKPVIAMVNVLTAAAAKTPVVQVMNRVLERLTWRGGVNMMRTFASGGGNGSTLQGVVNVSNASPAEQRCCEAGETGIIGIEDQQSHVARSSTKDSPKARPKAVLG